MFNSEKEKHLMQTSRFFGWFYVNFWGFMPHSRPNTRKKKWYTVLFFWYQAILMPFSTSCVCWDSTDVDKRNPRLGHTKNLLRQCLLTLDKQGIGVTCKRSSTKSLKMVTLWLWWCYGFIPCIPLETKFWISKSIKGKYWVPLGGYPSSCSPNITPYWPIRPL